MAAAENKPVEPSASSEGVPPAYQGLGAGEGYVVPPGLISLGAMVNAVADRIRPPTPLSKIENSAEQATLADENVQHIRRKAEKLLRCAAESGDLTLQFQDGCSLERWYWSCPPADRTIESGFFCGPENKAWRRYMYQPMFARMEQFDSWLATIPGGSSKSKSVQSSTGETVAQEHERAALDKSADPPLPANEAKVEAAPTRPYKLSEEKAKGLEAKYRRIQRIRDDKWPDKSKRPSGRVMAEHVMRTAAEHDLRSAGQGAKIELSARAIAQICDETYKAVAFLNLKRSLKR